MHLRVRKGVGPIVAFLLLGWAEARAHESGHETGGGRAEQGSHHGHEGSGCCGHQGGWSGLVALEKQLAETAERLLAGDRAVLPQRHLPLAEGIVAEMLRRHPEAFSLPSHQAHHHHHADDEASAPRNGAAERWRQRGQRVANWVRHLPGRLKREAVHTAGNIAEGLGEYGLTYGLITGVAEGVDHLILDEFVPVVGQIPFCVLIAGFARGVSEVTTQSIAVWRGSGGGPVRRARAVRQWWRAWRGHRARLKSQTFERPGADPLLLSKPGPVAKMLNTILKRKSTFTELAATLSDNEIRWLFEESSAWPEIARRALVREHHQGHSERTHSATLDELLAGAIDAPDAQSRFAAALATVEGLRLFKRLSGALITAAHREGRLPTSQMIKLRWRAGQLGRTAGLFGRRWLKVVSPPEGANSEARAELIARFKPLLERTLHAARRFSDMAQTDYGKAYQRLKEGLRETRAALGSARRSKER
jgi:hypothetical protein